VDQRVVTAPRVAYVLATTKGGTGRHVAMLVAGCAAAGLAVGVFGPAETRSLLGLEPGEDQETAHAWFEVVPISYRPRPASDLAAVRRLRRLLAARAPDVVHAHGLRAGALAALALPPSPSAGWRRPGGWPARRGPAGTRSAGPGSAGPGSAGPGSAGPGSAGPGSAGGRPAVPRRPGGGPPALVVTVHNAPPAGAVAAAIYGLLERLVARRADVVLCVSSDLAARMRRRGARKVGRAIVPASAPARTSTPAPAPAQAPVPAPAPAPGPAPIPPRTDAGRAGAGQAGVSQRPAELGAERRPVVLAVGRLAAQKGFETLIEAATRWRDRRPEPLLVIAGTGPLDADLAAQARDCGVGVRFLGWRDDVAALLAAADVLALPSRWEGQPLILQEALRAGRPIVAADVGGVRDLTGDAAALLVRPGDPAALAAAVLGVLDDPGAAVRLGAAAAARAATLPTEADAIAAALALYERLTNS